MYSPVGDSYLNKKNVVQADVFYVSHGRRAIIKEDGIYGAPDLVIEILSKRTWKVDTVKKKEAYQNAGVIEYWVVDAETKWGEGFCLENEQFASLGETTGKLSIRLLNLDITF